MAELFDVVAVNMETRKVRLLSKNKTDGNAEAIIMMAIDRLGVDTEFFAEVKAGKYKDGDEWKSEDEG